MSQIEFTPEVFTTDYIGEPGSRTFYLQARDASRALSYLIEKQQVLVLAEKLKEMLVLIDDADPITGAPPARDPALQLAGPVEPEWRIGVIGLAYEEDRDRLTVLVRPASEEAGEPDDLDDADLDDAGEGARFLLRRDQVRSFVRHAEAVVDEGRPLCQLCGLPIDPIGHMCPASNGHRSSG
jgi:uncharacterized repeat protein (TIGR03847 family)